METGTEPSGRLQVLSTCPYCKHHNLALVGVILETIPCVMCRGVYAAELNIQTTSRKIDGEPSY